MPPKLTAGSPLRSGSDSRASTAHLTEQCTITKHAEQTRQEENKGWSLALITGTEVISSHSSDLRGDYMYTVYKFTVLGTRVRNKEK